MQKRCTIHQEADFQLGSKYSKFFCMMCCAGFCTMLLGVVFPFVPQKFNAGALIDDDLYSLTLHPESEGSVIDIKLNPTTSGAISVFKDTVRGTTNAPSGYKLYISMAGDTSNLTSGGSTIYATSGTYSSPAALSLTDSRSAVWGYAVPGLNNFDNTYNTESPAATAKFAAMPVAGNEQLIHTHAGTATKDPTDIYYGVKANLGLAAGNYQGSIRYLAVTDISSEASGEASTSVSVLDEGYSSTTTEITTSLKSDITLTNSNIEAKIGTQVCTNPTIISQSPSLKFSCTIPAGLAGGQYYDITINVPKVGKGYTITNGLNVQKKFTITFSRNNTSYGTVSPTTLSIVQGATLPGTNTTNSSITIGGNTITATPNSGYEFKDWTHSCGATLTGACTITANFEIAATTFDQAFANAGKSKATANDGKQYYKMQDTESNICTSVTDGQTTTLVDSRDSNSYTVAKINGQCWMTQNLRITGTISSTGSNFTRVSSFNVSQYDLTNTTYCNSGTSSAPKGYTNVCSHNSGDNATGVWYNYAAATAGQITGYSNSTAATQDICPSGWHLPSGPSTTSNTDFNKLVGNTTSGWQNPTTGLTAFGAVAGGYYLNGSLSGTGYGYWWSATARSTTDRYSLLYNSSNGQFYGYVSSYRYYGFFVRCVRSS